MNAFATLFLLLTFLGFYPSAAFAQHNDTETIDQFISKQESRERGYQAKGIRTVIKGDLNLDGNIDAAVLYTLEGQNGTNNYVQYLAVFLQVKGLLVHVANMPVGGKQYRSVAFTSIKDNVIYLKTLSYAEKDPACCPTLKGSTRYELAGNKLKELPRR